MKDVATWFSAEDFISLMVDKSDRTISFTENLIYNDGQSIKIFSDSYDGLVVDKPRGNGNSIENVAEFDGKTISERRGEGGFTHSPEDFVWYQFAQWYSQR